MCFYNEPKHSFSFYFPTALKVGHLSTAATSCVLQQPASAAGLPTTQQVQLNDLLILKPDADSSRVDWETNSDTGLLRSSIKCYQYAETVMQPLAHSPYRLSSSTCYTCAFFSICKLWWLLSHCNNGTLWKDACALSIHPPQAFPWKVGCTLHKL